MKRAFKAFAVAAAGLAIALLAPAHAWAACPGNVPFSSCLLGGGGAIMPGTAAGGTFWIPGQGNDLVGAGDTAPGFGNDAGGLAGAPGLPLDGSTWITDFGLGGGLICLNWDWASSGSDGCGDGLTQPMAAVLRDDLGNFALMQVGGNTTAFYDFDTINNGGPGPVGGAGSNGVTLAKAVHVTSSADLGSTVQVTVAPLGLSQYDDQGGARAIPGVAHLFSGNTDLGVGPTVTVPADTDLCWQLVDGLYHVTLGCRSIGGLTPSQNVINGKADFARGGVNFSWDVTAQFDVLGFNIYQKNVTKGTSTKVNPTLIPLSGDNDATAESYKYLAARSDLKAVRGGFEIELVRQNGQTSRAPVQLTK